MNLSTIELPVKEATKLYDEYAEAAKDTGNAEDAAIARGFKALAEGRRIIRLTEVLAAGGVDEMGRPRIAIASARAAFCWLALGWRGEYVADPTAKNGQRYVSRYNGACSFRVDPDYRPRYSTSGDLHRQVDVPRGTLPNDTLEASSGRGNYRYRAMVPNVPPRHRPARGLAQCHILFEAEWAIDPIPPVDPALVRHLGGDLWVVFAEWDLTELERAVLAGRL